MHIKYIFYTSMLMLLLSEILFSLLANLLVDLLILHFGVYMFLKSSSEAKYTSEFLFSSGFKNLDEC